MSALDGAVGESSRAFFDARSSPCTTILPQIEPTLQTGIAALLAAAGAWICEDG